MGDFPPSPLPLTCKSFPIPQINQNQHGLEDVRCEQQEKQINNPYKHSQISLILSLVLSLGNFLTHIGFHIVTSVSCVFWMLTDLQALCGTEVKSEERWGDGGCGNVGPTGSWAPYLISQLTFPITLSHYNLRILRIYLLFSISVSNLYLFESLNNFTCSPTSLFVSLYFPPLPFNPANNRRVQLWVQGQVFILACFFLSKQEL